MFQKMNDNEVIMTHKHSYIWSSISESSLFYYIMNPTVSSWILHGLCV